MSHEVKYIGMDTHIIAVVNGNGKLILWRNAGFLRPSDQRLR